MSTLHEYLTDYVATLQNILNKHQDKDNIITALTEQYPEGDHRREWILDQLRNNSLKKGIKPTSDDSQPESSPTNKPVHKTPPEI
ncbi:hypothetical protein [Candidatus Albibeggiatoa sp. nov. BB20]|uniref:hypothetical protein n=1 Tax=Candidatus Albibeggiatoa sp. nov. BB20 TaxID=3162723 RepID=UPI00336539A5